MVASPIILKACATLSEYQTPLLLLWRRKTIVKAILLRANARVMVKQTYYDLWSAKLLLRASFHSVFEMMYKGKSMLVRGVELAPQIPGANA